MDITQKNEFQLLIRYADYCTAISQTAESNKPGWFDMDQQLALSIIYKNMTQTHLFPMDRAMFRHMKDQYKLMFTKALAWQIKYVNDNQELYDNPTQYLASHTLGTSSTGPITQATLETLMNVLAPKARYYLEQMGWLYKSLTDQYELSQFYDATIDDDYATESYVLEKMEEAMNYADLGDQEIKSYVDQKDEELKTYADETFQAKLPEVIKDYFLHANEDTGELEWKAVAQGEQAVTKQYVDEMDQSVLATATSRVNEVKTDLESEVTRATNRENEIEDKLPTKTSQLQNDSGFIDKTVNNLDNYYTNDIVDEKIATAEGNFLGGSQGTALDVANDEAASKFIGDYLDTIEPRVTVTKNDYFNIEVVSNDEEQNTEYYRYIATGNKITIGEKEYDGFKFGFKFSGDISLLKSQVKTNTDNIANEVTRATNKELELQNNIDLKLDATKSTYQTTAPTSAITDNGVHIVYLESEPETKYEGYIYMIKEEA